MTALIRSNSDGSKAPENPPIPHIGSTGGRDQNALAERIGTGRFLKRDSIRTLRAVPPTSIVKAKTERL
jgi:hypothetical protein